MLSQRLVLQLSIPSMLMSILYALYMCIDIKIGDCVQLGLFHHNIYIVELARTSGASANSHSFSGI